jgi:hypothetical protein
MTGRTTCEYCGYRIRVTAEGKAYGHADKKREANLLCLGSFTAVDLSKVDYPAPKVVSAPETTPPQNLQGVHDNGLDDSTWWERNGADVLWYGGSLALAVGAFIAGWTLACFGVPWS